MSSLNYRDAGVDIEAGEQLVERIKPLVKKTNRPGVLGGLGGFGGLFELPVDKYRQPVLVSGTDGVGTKLKLALEWQNHSGVGIDLVAMCVNDIVVTGAEPLFFLDYYATSKLDNDVAVQVIAGIAKGCSLAGCALVGGETAEMPGMYQHGDYDLAGFAVGIVEKDQIIASERVVAGDVLLGLASSGAHSNGYSLIRKVLERSGIDAASLDLDGQSLAEAMLAPTKIYVKSLLKLIETHEIHGMAHITGGGITENLPRALPENLDAHVTIGSWESQALFSWLRQHGNIEESEMLRTFNCGIGMVVIAPAAEAKAIEACLTGMGEKVFTIGQVEAGEGEPQVIYKR